LSSVELTRPEVARRQAAPAARVADLSLKGGIVALVLIIWLVPIKRYTLPGNLPFNLELYRLGLLVLVAALAIGLLSGRRGFGFAGQGKPLAVLALGALAAQLVNLHQISADGLQTQSLKSLSFFLSFLIAYVVVSSGVHRIEQADTILRAMVLAAVIVAVEAIYESRTQRNLFDDLNRILPFLRKVSDAGFKLREGRLRVRSSSQHPIALAIALFMMPPLAIYLSRRAATKLRARLWLLCIVPIVIGAVATIARTGFVVLVVSLIVGLVLRPQAMRRYWWALIPIIAVVHVASPGSIGHLYRAFHPPGGLAAQQQSRGGENGSGRLADISPGVQEWKTAPVFGEGLGTSPTLADPIIVQSTSADAAVGHHQGIIFDDQYLTTLVNLGIVGFIGIIWFVWGGIFRMGKAAKRTVGPRSDLLVACTAACVGYAAGMVTLDSLSFVQVSLLFFVLMAIGLRAASDSFAG
jgi:hypothetical membrane protein